VSGGAPPSLIRSPLRPPTLSGSSASFGPGRSSAPRSGPRGARRPGSSSRSGGCCA